MCLALCWHNWRRARVFSFRSHRGVNVAQEANFFFTFPVMHGEEASRWTFDGSLKDNRAVLLINQSKIPAILEKLFKVCA